MAQLIVRQLDSSVKSRLKQRAERHGRSMEEEVRDILQNAVAEEGKPISKLGTRIAARFKNIGLTENLPELRGQKARRARFER